MGILLPMFAVQCKQTRIIPAIVTFLRGVSGFLSLFFIQVYVQHWIGRPHLMWDICKLPGELLPFPVCYESFGNLFTWNDAVYHQTWSCWFGKCTNKFWVENKTDHSAFIDITISRIRISRWEQCLVLRKIAWLFIIVISKNKALWELLKEVQRKLTCWFASDTLMGTLTQIGVHINTDSHIRWLAQSTRATVVPYSFVARWNVW